jgi:DNA-binding transcriptional regulator YhcF (GntR family)
VNPVTTARAYRELEAEGVTETRQGAGTFVGPKRVRFSLGERKRRLAPQVDQLLVNALQMGLSFDTLLDIINERRKAVIKDREKT